MSMGTCLNCEHCDTNRTNDIGEVRCKRFSTFVSVLHRCDFYLCKGINELAEKLKGVIPNDR